MGAGSGTLFESTRGVLQQSERGREESRERERERALISSISSLALALSHPLSRSFPPQSEERRRAAPRYAAYAAAAAADTPAVPPQGREQTRLLFDAADADSDGRLMLDELVAFLCAAVDHCTEPLEQEADRRFRAIQERGARGGALAVVLPACRSRPPFSPTRDARCSQAGKRSRSEASRCTTFSGKPRRGARGSLRRVFLPLWTRIGTAGRSAAGRSAGKKEEARGRGGPGLLQHAALRLARCSKAGARLVARRRLNEAEYRAFSAPALSPVLRRKAAHDFLVEADADADGRATRDEFLAGAAGRASGLPWISVPWLTVAAAFHFDAHAAALAIKTEGNDTYSAQAFDYRSERREKVREFEEEMDQVGRAQTLASVGVGVHGAVCMC